MVTKKFKPPKRLGACADLLYQMREQRHVLQRQVDLLKEDESILINHLIDNLPKSDATGVAGSVARATVYKKMIPVVKDWDLLYKHIKKTGAFELLQRRLGEGAVTERWDANKVVPGVESFNAIKISLNKV